MRGRDIDTEGNTVGHEALDKVRIGIGSEVHPVGSGDDPVAIAPRDVVSADAQGLQQEFAVAPIVAKQCDGGVAGATLDILRRQPDLLELFKYDGTLVVATDSTEIPCRPPGAAPMHGNIEGIAADGHQILRQIDIETIVADGDEAWGGHDCHALTDTRSRYGSMAARLRFHAATGSSA